MDQIGKAEERSGLGAFETAPARSNGRSAFFRHVDYPVLVAFGFVVLMWLVAGTQDENFLSAEYLLQQLQTASFLGIIASGAMLVILLGHIDLSIPWVVTVGGMMATAAAGWWGHTGAAIAIPFAMLCGLLFGVINGLGVAYLRIPSMIFTLGVNALAQGLMVLHTGGFAPQDHSTDLMHWLAVQRSLSFEILDTPIGIPNVLFVWLVVGGAVVFILRFTPFGRYIYAFGNRESATYLSGVNTRGVLVACFALCSMLAALAGVLIAGRATKAYQAMGDEFLLPSIAAVVLGGTNILGGRGTYLGTIAGVILITLLQSILSLMPLGASLEALVGIKLEAEAIRQIIYGTVIIVMLLVYGRSAKVQG
jgi:ribose transport system permease protein